jgi:pimeloyl-ACP methyl ester carboxylesterase
MPKRRWFLPLLPLILLLSASAAGAVPAAQAAARAHLEPCSLKGHRGAEIAARCGYFETWENRAARSGRKIRLKVIVLPATGRHPLPDPIFFFGGGPGEAITIEARGQAQAWKGLRRKRDLVFIDQRGTGEPDRLGCNLGGEDADLQTYLGEMFPVAAVKACRDELEKKYDLTLYTTDVAMDDVDDARAWLGYGKINLVGGSYGTRAAQVYLRRHPGSVRSVILQGVVPMDEALPISHAAGGQRSLDLLLGWCEADAACHRAYPKVRAELAAVLEGLGRGPVEVEVKHPRTHEKVKVSVSRELIADGIRWELYSEDSGAAVPRLIHDAAGGDLAPLAQAAIDARLGIIDFIAHGMFFSVTCSEDFPFIDPAEIAARTAGSFLGDYRVRQQMRACAEWPRAKVTAEHREAVHSGAPVLLLSGERDPVTPPDFARRAARFLTDSLLVTVPFAGHEDSPDCIEGIEHKLIKKGSVQGLDTSCVARIARPPFQVSSTAPKNP